MPEGLDWPLLFSSWGSRPPCPSRTAGFSRPLSREPAACRKSPCWLVPPHLKAGLSLGGGGPVGLWLSSRPGWIYLPNYIPIPLFPTSGAYQKYRWHAGLHLLTLILGHIGLWISRDNWSITYCFLEPPFARRKVTPSLLPGLWVGCGGILGACASQRSPGQGWG